MKKCPYCSEDIKDKIIKCKYCGEILSIWRYWFKLRNFAPFILFLATLWSLHSAVKQVNIANEQLRQSQLDSAIINRPYVEIKPISFFQGVDDPKDPTSQFCHLNIEIKNYSGNIPATNVMLKDFKIAIKPRVLTPEIFSQAPFSNICIFPNQLLKQRLTFIMNKEENIKPYFNGEKQLEIYLKIAYEGIKDSKNKPQHWYSCSWKFGKDFIDFIDSNTDLVK